MVVVLNNTAGAASGRTLNNLKGSCCCTKENSPAGDQWKATNHFDKVVLLLSVQFISRKIRNRSLVEVSVVVFVIWDLRDGFKMVLILSDSSDV